MKKILATLLLFTGLYSCTPKMSSSNVVFTSRWVLSELNGQPVQLSHTDRDANLEFSYSEKKVSGSGGCNRIYSTYEIDKKGNLNFAPFASTKMACEDSKFENLFLEALKKVNKYAVKDDILELKKNKEVLARFLRR